MTARWSSEPHWLGDARDRAECAGRRRDGAAGDGRRARGVSGPRLIVARRRRSRPCSRRSPPRRPTRRSRSRDREAAQLRGPRSGRDLLLPNSFRPRGGAGAAFPSAGAIARTDAALLTRAVPAARRVHQSPTTCAGARAGHRRASTSCLAIVAKPATRERARRCWRDRWRDRPAPLVGFAPGAAYGHAKRWPPDRVAQVIARSCARRRLRAGRRRAATAKRA